MKKYITVLILFFLIKSLICGFVNASDTDIPKELRFAFPEKNIEIKKNKHSLDLTEQKKVKTLSGTRFVDKDFIYYSGFDKGKLTGYAVLKYAYSKSGKMKLLITLNPEFKIKFIEIFEYNYPQGSKVKKKRFKKQFKNKSIKDTLILKRDIDNVTGATISARAVTKTVKKVLSYFDIIKLTKYDENKTFKNIKNDTPFPTINKIIKDN